MSGSRSRNRGPRDSSDRDRRGNRSAEAAGSRALLGSVPSPVSDGARTSTSWSSCSSPRSSASCWIVSRAARLRRRASRREGRSRDRRADRRRGRIRHERVGPSPRAPSWIADEHDVGVGIEHRGRPLGEASTEPDVDRALHVPGCEVGWLAGIEQDRAGIAPRDDLVDRRARGALRRRATGEAAGSAVRRTRSSADAAVALR